GEQEPLADEGVAAVEGEQGAVAVRGAGVAALGVAEVLEHARVGPPAHVVRRPGRPKARAGGRPARGPGRRRRADVADDVGEELRVGDQVAGVHPHDDAGAYPPRHLLQDQRLPRVVPAVAADVHVGRVRRVVEHPELLDHALGSQLLEQGAVRVVDAQVVRDEAGLGGGGGGGGGRARPLLAAAGAEPPRSRLVNGSRQVLQLARVVRRRGGHDRQKLLLPAAFRARTGAARGWPVDRAPPIRRRRIRPASERQRKRADPGGGQGKGRGGALQKPTTRARHLRPG
ncbi:MAG: hypothetical protein BJ554DRAFT_7559, partial [Olpidium bornovanus]